MGLNRLTPFESIDASLLHSFFPMSTKMGLDHSGRNGRFVLEFDCGHSWLQKMACKGTCPLIPSSRTKRSTINLFVDPILLRFTAQYYSTSNYS